MGLKSSKTGTVKYSVPKKQVRIGSVKIFLSTFFSAWTLDRTSQELAQYSRHSTVDLALHPENLGFKENTSVAYKLLFFFINKMHIISKK